MALSFSAVFRLASAAVALSFVLPGPAARAQVSPAADQPGHIVIGSPIYDFGVVPQGTVVRHDFEIKNDGAGVLHIDRVITQCGCTASSASKDTLKPGETGVIAAAFDTAAFTGNKEKLITVLTTDPQNRSAQLTLRGRIEAGVRIEPENLTFGEVSRGIEAQLQFTVTALGGNKVLSAKSLKRWLTVRETGGNDKGMSFQVAMTPDAPVGDLRARVVVELQGEDGKLRSQSVPVFAVVKGPLRLTPPVVSLGIIEGTEPIARSAALDYRGRGEIEIESITSSDSALEVTREEKNKGKSYSLSLSVDPSKIAKDFKGVVTVLAKLPDGTNETVSLSVLGIRPPR